MVVILLVVFPVGFMMTMGVVAALLGSTTKSSVDADHADSELLDLSEADPY